MIGFVDIETTGLNPDRHSILEIAVIWTQDNLDEIDSAEYQIAQTDFILENMDEWCLEQHGESGLIEDVKEDGISIREVEQNLIEKFEDIADEDDEVAMGGNSVHFDRGFLKRKMPDFESEFFYRNIDVSVFKELLGRWNMEEEIIEEGDRAHRASSDIRECIGALSYYRNKFFKN
jgi:oligoribonuclease